MSENNFNTVMSSLLNGASSVLSAKTVVGEPVMVGETIIIPLVDVSFGMGAGAGAGEKKDKGSGGIGGKMSPSAVLVIQGNKTKLINIKQQDGLTKILDMVPDIIEKFTHKNDDIISDEEATQKAFPEDSL